MKKLSQKSFFLKLIILVMNLIMNLSLTTTFLAKVKASLGMKVNRRATQRRLMRTHRT
jgi:hypothetical protein